MPIYEYRCGNCGKTFDVLAKFSDPDPTVCEHCGAEGQLEKVLHPAAVHYKGSGFYATDYSKGGSGTNPSSGEAGGGAESGSGPDDSGSGDSGSGSGAGDAGSSAGGSGSDSSSTPSSSPPTSSD